MFGYMPATESDQVRAIGFKARLSLRRSAREYGRSTIQMDAGAVLAGAC